VSASKEMAEWVFVQGENMPCRRISCS